jgi:hypothetical protein
LDCFLDMIFDCFWHGSKVSHMLHVWYIYQHLPQKTPSFVGKYTSSMVRIWGMLKILFRTMGMIICRDIGWSPVGELRSMLKSSEKHGTSGLW